jgi:hypothetical protein
VIQSANKPIPVWIVAGFAWFAAFISLLVGIVLLFPGSGFDRIWQWNQPAHVAFQSMGKWVGAAFLVLVIPAGIIAIGFSRGRRWAWWAAVVMFVVNGLGDVGSLIVMRDYVRVGSGIVVDGIFLMILFGRAVRGYFDECSRN